MRKLEEELKEKRGREKQIENLELQQLRYVLLHGSREELSDKYMPVRILPEQFIVCCYEEKQIYPEPKGAVLLGEMGQYTVLIADAGQIADLLNKELRSCHVGVSGAYRGIENLQRAYHEAMQARQEAFSLGARIVYFGEKTEEETGSSDVDGMEKIAHMLSTDKMEEALYRLERMAADTRRRKNSGALFAENIAVLVQKIQQIYQGTLKKEEYELTRLSELYRYPCISEFVEALSAWCIEFNKKMNTEYDNYAVKKKMQQALAYIQEHYAGDLNMAMVSNYISMNYSLFSNTFKQYTGNNFVTYLKNLRIREARRLLEETDLRVGQIGQMVGYENEKHFMKIFKSMCGVTPTEFRKNTAYKE